jgi:hypothetical protein
MTDLAELLANSGKMDEERQARHRLIKAAARTASQCPGCGKALAANEPVWRVCVSLGVFFGSWHYRIAPHCERCKPEPPFAHYEDAAACETCGRTVHDPLTIRYSRHTFCCDDCRKRAEVAIARQKRNAAKSTTTCDTCGKIFGPAREDARFCSAACRQKAYRQRVTDN